MKQLLNSFGSGEILLADVPTPQLRPGHVLIGTRRSVVSIGTERMLVEFGRAGLLAKARQQPERVKQALQKIRTDGLIPTIQTVRAKLDQPIPLGYCNAGVVIGVGDGVDEFRVGDRIASNGAHAEYVLVPKNLCAAIPAAVPDEAAAFTVVAAIGLQGIRLLQPTLGESVVVTGLGLIGLLSVQILKAHGCRVLGIDVDPAKCALALRTGAEAVVDLSLGADPVAAAEAFSRGRGVDAVLVAASTSSNEPIHQGATMCRQRGRIVLVGTTGLELQRADFYRKEISFQVSCSYGPGRYDKVYEEAGRDYPVGLVRWTEQRNLEAVLELMRVGALRPAPLISERYRFDDALRAYESIGTTDALGIVLEYPEQSTALDDGRRSATVDLRAPASIPGEPTIAVVGAGNFAQQVMLPALQATGVRIKAIVSSAGVSGTHAARKFGAEQSSTDLAAVLRDPEIDAVFLATRHGAHARQVTAALRAGKRVFVEKPLCITREELADVRAACQEVGAPFLMIGFNRRFAPHIVRLKSLLVGVPQPKTLVITINAGAMPADSWVQDRENNGPRVISEGCHFVDLAYHLIGQPIVSVSAAQMRLPGRLDEDTVTMTFTFADGSLATVHYFANGHRAYPKERLQLFVGERVVELDNFRRMRAYGWPGFDKLNLVRQDKGHAAEIRATVNALRRGAGAPIPLQDIFDVHEATFAAYDLATGGQPAAGLTPLPAVPQVDSVAGHAAG